MRVIAGQYRGRSLKTLKGDATRPTTDRVKEALMSSVRSHYGDLEGARVLDAFAGSGSLGIEALSRGASFVLFADQARPAQAVIQGNVKSLNINHDAWSLYRGDTFSLPRTLQSSPFDLVFLDPPYAFDAEDVIRFIDELDQFHLITQNALIIYEFARKDKEHVLSVLSAHTYVMVTAKDYGDTSVVLARKDNE